jgi:hypothetical protein
MPDDAYALQGKAEQWQDLATRQHELGTHLRLLSSRQRELSAAWEMAGDEVLTSEAEDLVTALHSLAIKVLGLERAALDRMAEVVESEGRALRRR